MIGANDLIAVGHIGFGTEKQRAVIGHVVQKKIRILCKHFHMFVGQLIGFYQGLLFISHQYDHSIICPCYTGNISRWQHLQLPFNFNQSFVCQFFASGN